jgi:hypothetical protein
MFRLFFLVCVMSACIGAVAANPSDMIRVYAIEPASFDYVFTAIVSSSATNPVLSFNHRSGRTFFVRPGERLGDYGVSDFKLVTTQVFNPAIKMNQERKTGRVTLSATNQAAIILELGKRLSRPGWMAYLVNLSDGNWWSVKEGDTVMAGAQLFGIGPVNSNSVVLISVGRTNEAPVITGDEAKQLAALWDSRIRKRSGAKAEEELMAAQEPDNSWLEVAQAQVPQPVARPVSTTVVMQYPSRTFFGTDYSCPVEYTVLPGIWSSSGHLIRPTMVIPRRFETRSSGLSMEYR